MVFHFFIFLVLSHFFFKFYCYYLVIQTFFLQFFYICPKNIIVNRLMLLQFRPLDSGPSYGSVDKAFRAPKATVQKIYERFLKRGDVAKNRNLDGQGKLMNEPIGRLNGQRLLTHTRMLLKSVPNSAQPCDSVTVRTAQRRLVISAGQ